MDSSSYAKIKLKYDNFSEWIKIKNSLLNSEYLSTLDIISISNTSAIVFIKFLSKEKLVNDLEEKNIYINLQNEMWEISLNS